MAFVGLAAPTKSAAHFWYSRNQLAPPGLGFIDLQI
jgi:hypothetical protein